MSDEPKRRGFFGRLRAGLSRSTERLTGGITAGSRVMVMWSDGNRYPGQVLQAAPNQYLVQFEGGSQQWIPSNAVVQA